MRSPSLPVVGMMCSRTFKLAWCARAEMSVTSDHFRLLLVGQPPLPLWRRDLRLPAAPARLFAGRVPPSAASRSTCAITNMVPLQSVPRLPSRIPLCSKAPFRAVSVSKSVSSCSRLFQSVLSPRNCRSELIEMSRRRRILGASILPSAIRRIIVRVETLRATAASATEISLRSSIGFSIPRI